MKKLEGFELEHGQAVTCEINGISIEGRISLNGSKAPYICQNSQNGAKADDLLGYEYSWCINSGIRNNNVKHLRLNNEKVFDIINIDGIAFKHGDRIECDIVDCYIEGKISLAGTDAPYICQNEKYGWHADDKLGYEHSWSINAGLEATDVKNIILNGIHKASNITASDKEQVVTRDTIKKGSFGIGINDTQEEKTEELLIPVGKVIPRLKRFDPIIELGF